MAIETRGSLPRALWPGVKSWFGTEYADYPRFAERMFNMDTSSMAFEDDVEIVGMGMAHVKSEGNSTDYESITQGYTSRYTHVSYGLGFIVTREEFDDNQYNKVARARSRALARAFRHAKETVSANVLNNAFSGSYLGGDGVALLSNAHPTRAGNQSNILAVAADFSEASVEDLFKLMMQAKDSSGMPIPMRATKLIVGTDNAFEVERLFKSVGRVGTADNDTNALRSMGVLPSEIIVNPYLTDSDAWFIVTDVQDGLKGYTRTALEIRRDNDFDTLNLKVAGFERYSFGWSDWRGLYGTAGA